MRISPRTRRIRKVVADEHSSHRPAARTGPGLRRLRAAAPLAGQGLLESHDADRLGEHLAGCDHCRAVLAAYDRLDSALAR